MLIYKKIKAIQYRVLRDLVKLVTFTMIMTADKPGHVHQEPDGALPAAPGVAAGGRARADHGGAVLAAQRHLAGSHLGVYWSVSFFSVPY